MLIFAIDDEKIALSELVDAINKALPSADTESFLRSSDALKRIKTEEARPDVVFSDIRMPGLDGLQLAVEIKKYSPDTKIVFVTGYSEYAMDAFKVHANGYLMKPVLPENITEEMDFLQLPYEFDASKLRVQCFGNFEVFYNGEPIAFKRRQTKELFAYLIDLNGASCSAEETATVLWEDESDMRKAKHRLRNLVLDLRSVLKGVGREDILIRGSGTLAIRRDAIDCDYFRMLDGDMTAVNAYHGEYMKQYSWAQLTENRLYFDQK